MKWWRLMAYFNRAKRTGFEQKTLPVREEHKGTWKSCTAGPSTGSHWKWERNRSRVFSKQLERTKREELQKRCWKEVTASFEISVVWTKSWETGKAPAPSDCRLLYSSQQWQRKGKQNLCLLLLGSRNNTQNKHFIIFRLRTQLQEARERLKHHQQ